MVESIWLMFIVIILIVYLVLKVVLKKQAVATRLALYLFVIIMLTVGYVYMSSDSEIKTVKDVFNFGGVYFSWIGSVFHNFRSLTANAVQEDWSINNATRTG
ncbi:MAG: hypothetical protein AABX68_00100 [Nanoarchaeota archaeon]